MPHTNDPAERAILDQLQREIDSMIATIRGFEGNWGDAWSQRRVRIALGRRVQLFMEKAVLRAAAGHRSDAFHREFHELAELAWSSPMFSRLDEIDWDREFADYLMGGAA